MKDQTSFWGHAYCVRCRDKNMVKHTFLYSYHDSLASFFEWNKPSRPKCPLCGLSDTIGYERDFTEIGTVAVVEERKEK